MNKYYLTARLTPAILTSIPVCTAYYYFISPFIFSETSEIHWLLPVGNVSLMTGLVFLLVQINRFLSKEIFQHIYFKDELEMPTTNYLMHNDTFYTVETKRSIKDKIKHDFGMELFDINRENSDESGARKQIGMAVAQIRVLLKSNLMLYRHNIEYGFVRNFLGGCIHGVIVSVIMAILFKIININPTMMWVSVGLAFFYLFFILASKTIVKKFGSYYAKILFEQYLIMNKNEKVS